ncbi:hypothetical protein ONE63_001454 [Megalurothrips usitatus]|uniref:Uncharacterized protein n=1 Tax=Megalurothrips usitatus TaxID=439358 RepID=A0AAV7XJG7_9NEOP|nr:hypothetical protein ONE63_001454 [Megalurothrips usitatus]
MSTNNNPALPPTGAGKQKKWSAPTITVGGGLPALGSVDEYSTEVTYERRESSASNSNSRRSSAASGTALGLLFASRRPSRDSASRRGSESAGSVSSGTASARSAPVSAARWTTRAPRVGAARGTWPSWSASGARASSAPARSRTARPPPSPARSGPPGGTSSPRTRPGEWPSPPLLLVVVVGAECVPSARNNVRVVQRCQ